MNVSLSLFRLQKLFTRRAVIRARLTQIENLLAVDEHLKAADRARQEAAEQAANAKKAQSEHESKMKERQLKKELTHAQLFSGRVRNPKELQELETEEKNLTSLLARMDQERSALMAATEKARNEHAAAEENYQSALNQKASENALLSGERSKLQEELTPIGNQLKSLAQNIPPDIFSEFQSLLRLKKGRAVTEIIDGSCGACGMDLTAADQQLAKSSQKPIYCKNCGRMLFFKS